MSIRVEGNIDKGFLRENILRIYSEQSRNEMGRLFKDTHQNLALLPSLTPTAALNRCDLTRNNILRLIALTQVGIDTLEEECKVKNSRSLAAEGQYASIVKRWNDAQKSINSSNERLAKLYSDKINLKAQSSAISAQLVKIQSEIEAEEDIRSNGVWDLIPVLNIINAFRTGQPTRAIPGYSPVAAIISHISQKQETLEDRLKNTNAEKMRLTNEITATENTLIGLRTTVRSLENEMKRLETERKSIDQQLQQSSIELTRFKNLNTLLKTILSKYKFLAEDIDSIKDEIKIGIFESSNLIQEMKNVQNMLLV